MSKISLSWRLVKVELEKLRQQSIWRFHYRFKEKGDPEHSLMTQFFLSIFIFNSSVGILDGDIFGPSVPLMMNIKETPLIDENNMIIPPINFGIKCLSMGLLVEDSSAVVWRGPLVMSALQRLLKGANWV